MTVAQRTQRTMERTGATGPPLLSPGSNCWRVERAERFRCIQDAADYFRLVRQAILKAERTVFIVGWDISSMVDLVPGAEDDGVPAKLGALLDHVVKRRKRLRVYINVWDYMALYILERDPFSPLRFRLRNRRRIRFCFDDRHPLGASHHQKLVVVDDRLAFSGGIDLTGHRWDKSEHLVDEPLRKTQAGKCYEPYHEVQAMVDGNAALALGELARDRWVRAGRRRPPPPAPSGPSLWPDDVEPDLEQVDVGIARTEPAYLGDPEVRENERLFLDAIARARKTIYVENQYFTSMLLVDALAARLREPGGPEVVVVIPKECCGWLEQRTMGVLRDQALAKLKDADRHGRLRALYAAASVSKDVAIFIHSKVMVVDDEVLRIGSANMSSRSLGLDTECDLVVEARGERRLRTGIAAVMARLVGEHLGRGEDEVRATLERTGSLRATVDALAGDDRTLVPIEVKPDPPPLESAAKAAVDPSEPIELSQAADRLFPEIEAGARARPSLLAIPALLAALVFLLVLGLDAMPGSANEIGTLLAAVRPEPRLLAGAVAAGAVAIYAFVPLRLVVLATALLLGPLRGMPIALAACLASAAAGYATGSLLGPRRLAAALSRRTYRLGRLLRRGPVTVALLRLLSAPPAAGIHLLCGAFKVAPRDFALGTLLDLGVEVTLLGLAGGLLRLLLLDPSPGTLAATAGVLVGAALLGLRSRSRLLQRQLASGGGTRGTQAELG